MSPRELLMTYQGLPRPVYILAVARGISALGAFVYPFLTLTLTLKLQLSEAEAGLILSGVGVMSLIGTTLGGWLSDRHSKVKILIFAQLGAALSLTVAGFLSDSVWLTLPLLLGTFSISHVRAPSAALITELTPKEQRTRAFSLGHLGTNLGFSFGPLIAAYLFERAPAWIFWGDALTTFISASLVWWCLGDRPRPSGSVGPALEALPPQSELEEEMEGGVWAVLKARPQLIGYALSGLLMTFAYAQVTFSLPITLSQSVGGEGTELFGLVMSGNGLFVLLLTPLLTQGSERRANLSGLQLASLCYVFGFGVIALAPHLAGLDGHLPLYILLTLSVATWTAGEVYSVNHGSAFVAQETPASHRGRVNALLPVILGVTRSLTPALSGLLLSTLSLAQFWLIIGLTPLGSLGVLTWMRRRWGRAR